ncbi:MAG: DUF411 domain-containing protein [Actinomycetia bacterium]|nr:DUF411 domain-containing protein [Actinomycetes bacterium]
MDLTEDPQLAQFKVANGVPVGAASCHTALVDGYVVEGHVPSGAITKLLAERPDAVGLALPGMPADSPGMGGTEATWDAQDVLLIQYDGQLIPYDY